MRRWQHKLRPKQRVSGRLDPDEFVQELRQLALDAHRSLIRLDTTVDELIGLKCRFENLRREAQELRAFEIDGWLPYRTAGYHFPGASGTGAGSAVSPRSPRHINATEALPPCSIARKGGEPGHGCQSSASETRRRCRLACLTFLAVLIVLFSLTGKQPMGVDACQHDQLQDNISGHRDPRFII